MFGTLVTKGQLIKLVENDKVKITPFDPTRAQPAHYPIDAGIIYRRNGEEWKPEHDFRSKKEFVFEQSEYCVVEVAQSIVLASGYAGQFIPSSNLVEQGFSLVAGKVTYPFGQRGEKIRFGIKNMLTSKNKLKAVDRIAYLQLFDFSALDHINYELDERDVRVFLQRFHRADDDGPNYERSDSKSDDLL